jgi:hypothetical protein
LGANALLLAGGVGLLPLLGVCRSARQLAARAGLGYLVGLAAGGIAASTLALIRVPFGWPALVGFAGVFLALGFRRLKQVPRSPDDGTLPAFGRLGVSITIAGAVIVVGLLVRAAQSFAITPLVEWDAWAMWTMKARALAVLGWADPSFFADPALAPAHPRYPLLLPSLEAIDIRAMGGYESQLIHLQFLLFAFALVAALAALLWDRVHAVLLWPALLAIVSAPAFLRQLDTAYADIPLAIFFAVGVTASARWIATAERWALRVAALMFAATLLTKNEGALLVTAAFVALAVTAQRRQAKSLALACTASFAAVVPWWIYIAWHHVPRDDYRLSDLIRLPYVLDHADRGRAGLHALVQHLISVSDWSLLVPYALVAVALAFLAGSVRLPSYVVILSTGALLGMTLVYDISLRPIDWLIRTSAYRVVAPLVLASAAVAPLLLAEAYRERLERAAGEPVCPGRAWAHSRSPRAKV